MRRLLGIILIGLLLTFNLWGNNVTTQVYQNALEAYNHKNYSEAIRYLKKYLALVDSKSRLLPEAIFLIAQSYEKQKMNSLALDYYQTFIENYRDHGKISDVLLAMGKLYLTQTEYVNAQAVFQKIYKDYPTTYQAVEAMQSESQALLAQQKHEEAQVVIQKLLKKYPRHHLAHESAYALGEAWLEIGAFPQAKETFQHLLDLNPTRESTAAALYGLGWASFRQGLNPKTQKEVVTSLNRVVKEFSNTKYAAKCLFLIAEIALEMGNRPLAARKYELFIDKYPDNENRAKAMFEAAEIYQKEKETEKAISMLRSLIEEYPQDKITPNAYFFLGQYAQKAGDYLTAIEAFTHIINQSVKLKGDPAGITWNPFFRIASNNFLISVKHLKDIDFLIDAYFLLAEASEKLGEGNAGLQYYLLAKNRLPPDDQRYIKIRLGQALIHTKKKKWRKARTIYLELLEENPDVKTKIHLTILTAQTYFSEGYYPKAIELFSQIIDDYPEHLEVSLAYYWLGRIYFLKQQYSEAITNFHASIESREQQGIVLPEVLYKLGFSYFKMKNTVEALKALEELLAQFPGAIEAPKASFLVANIYYKIGNYFQAADHYKKIAEFFSDDPIAPLAQYRLAAIHLINNKFFEAVLEFNQFLVSFPKHELRDKAKFALAFSHFLAEDWKPARVALIGFVNDTPPNELTQQALYLLSLEAQYTEDTTLARKYLEEAEKAIVKATFDFEIKVNKADLQIDNSIEILNELSSEEEEYHSEAAVIFRDNSRELIKSLQPFSELLKITIDQLRKKHLKGLRKSVIEITIEGEL